MALAIVVRIVKIAYYLVNNNNTILCLPLSFPRKKQTHRRQQPQSPHQNTQHWLHYFQPCIMKVLPHSAGEVAYLLIFFGFFVLYYPIANVKPQPSINPNFVFYFIAPPKFLASRCTHHSGCVDFQSVLSSVFKARSILSKNFASLSAEC